MAKILKPKVQASGLMDSFELAIMKSVGERATAPIIGNGTIQSGGIKLIGAGILSSVSRNKHIGLLSSAFIVDGFEDIVRGLMPVATGAGDDTGGW